MVFPVAAAISGASSLAGGLVDQYFDEKASDKAWKREKKVLQNQVQWRVADAVKAGLHPLAALGMSPASGPGFGPGSSLGQSLSNMGQDIGRAAEAMLTTPDKSAARATELAIENAELQNEVLRTEIASKRMRNIQSATPNGPVTTFKSGSLPTPIVNDRFPVTYKGAGAEAENDYGDIAGSVFGVGYMLQDAVKYMGLERMLDTTKREWQAIVSADKAIQKRFSTPVGSGGFKAQYLKKYRRY